jgi:hypothetical protein
MAITATATSNQPITGWRIYVDGTTAYSAGAMKKISTSVPLSTGKHSIVVRAWAKNGSYGSATLTETVGSQTSTQAQGKVSTSSLAFGSVQQNTTSSGQSLVLTNTGSATLNVTGVSVSSSQFKLTGPTSTSIAPGGSYTYSVNFAPTAIATVNGSLTFSTNSAVAVPAVALSGTGVAGTASASLSPTSVSFGSQTVNTTSAGQNVTLSNTGTSSLSISSISASTNFKQSNGCGSSLAAGASCSIAVTFAPTVTGTLSGTLSLSSSAGSKTVALTGTGAAATNATKLFETDFGGNVYMATPNVGNCSSTNGWWPILGGDDGFSWPVLLNGSSSPGLQPISYGPNIYYDSNQKTINSCQDNSAIWKSEIIQGTRHDGTTGPILHRVNYKDMGWQLPYIVTPGSDVPDQYQKIWMKLPSNLGAILGPNSWFTFAEWKDSNYSGSSCPYSGYRVAIYIYTDSNGTPYWDMHGDNCPSGPYYWEKTSHTPVPLGQWMQFEWAWHRTHDNSSWTWVKINGTNIMEQDGGGSNSNGFYGPTAAPINRIFLGQIYGAKGTTEQWTDHIELWNKVPY